LQSLPTDSAFFPLLKHPDLVLDSLGGKYVVADQQHEFRLYFTKKDVVAGVQEESRLPRKTILSQNYPNPFNPETTITYFLPTATNVKLAIFDVLGREVSTLRNERQLQGQHQAQFDASNLASGVYFYGLSVGSTVVTKKMLLVH